VGRPEGCKVFVSEHDEAPPVRSDAADFRHANAPKIPEEFAIGFPACAVIHKQNAVRGGGVESPVVASVRVRDYESLPHKDGAFVRGKE